MKCLPQRRQGDLMKRGGGRGAREKNLVRARCFYGRKAAKNELNESRTLIRKRRRGLVFQSSVKKGHESEPARFQRSNASVRHWHGTKASEKKGKAGQGEGSYVKK